MKQLKVGTNELMEAFAVSRQTISNMVDQGMPKLDRGQFDLTACWQWRWNRREKEFQEKIAGGDLEEQETRLKRAQADLKEIDLAVKRGDLVEISKVTEANGRAVAAFRSKILSAPVKLAPRVIAARDVNEAKAILDEDAWEALNELAILTQGYAGGSDTAAHADPVSDRRSTTTAHAKRVGRQSKGAKQRVKRRDRKLEN